MSYSSSAIKDALYEVFNKRLHQGMVYDMDEILFDEYVNEMSEGELDKMAEILVDNFLNAKKGYLEDYIEEYQEVYGNRSTDGFSDDELFKKFGVHVATKASDGKWVIMVNR